LQRERLERSIMMTPNIGRLLGGLLLMSWTLVPALAAPTASAELKGPDGKSLGKAQLTEVASGGVLVRLELQGLSPGAHAFHIHETGRCDPPSFESAGGHFNPGNRPHGVMTKGGPHAGDLTNLHVPESGRLTVEVHAAGVTLEPGKPESLVGGNGTALVIHAKADDHASQPSGDAGGRIACGIIER
jgi:Cu-Zn family superoxide dismutase